MSSGPTPHPTRDDLAAALAVDMAVLKAAAPLCDGHLANGGARSGCVVCSVSEMSQALSRIDYLCGPPNDMEVSGYDMHRDPAAVVARVATLLRRIRGMSGPDGLEALLQLPESSAHTPEQAAPDR